MPALIPATPPSQTAYVSKAKAPTGTWRHPQFDEIVRRQSQATFTDRNLKTILWNGSILLGSWGLNWGVLETPRLPPVVQPLFGFLTYPLLVIRLLLLWNIVVAVLPLMRSKDDLGDVPLTPSQRALLGLDPNATPKLTPSSQYSTPPRYARSSTPRSDTSQGRGSNFSDSPLAGKGSAVLGRSQGETTFTPSINPLLQKAMIGGGRDGGRRSSYGSPSSPVVGTNLLETSLISLPPTPSPSGGRVASIGFSSKWMYERSKGSPVSQEMFS